MRADNTQSPFGPPLLLRQREAARMLSMSERGLWNHTVPRGEIPAIRIGRCVLYPVPELKRIIAKKVADLAVNP